jgi:hypothetical protein
MATCASVLCTFHLLPCVVRDLVGCGRVCAGKGGGGGEGGAADVEYSRLGASGGLIPHRQRAQYAALFEAAWTGDENAIRNATALAEGVPPVWVAVKEVRGAASFVYSDNSAIGSTFICLVVTLNFQLFFSMFGSDNPTPTQQSQ